MLDVVLQTLTSLNIRLTATSDFKHEKALREKNLVIGLKVRLPSSSLCWAN